MQYAGKPLQVLSKQREILPNTESDPSSEVETELFIGLPERRLKAPSFK